MLATPYLNKSPPDLLWISSEIPREEIWEEMGGDGRRKVALVQTPIAKMPKVEEHTQMAME